MKGKSIAIVVALVAIALIAFYLVSGGSADLQGSFKAAFSPKETVTPAATTTTTTFEPSDSGEEEKDTLTAEEKAAFEQQAESARNRGDEPNLNNIWDKCIDSGGTEDECDNITDPKPTPNP